MSTVPIDSCHSDPKNLVKIDRVGSIQWCKVCGSLKAAGVWNAPDVIKTYHAKKWLQSVKKDLPGEYHEIRKG